MVDYIHGGSIAVTIFILVVTGILFFLPKIFGKLSDTPWLDLIFRRSCYVIAMFLMSLNSVIMASIANAASLGINDELFMYMFLFGWGGYILMVILVLATLFELIGMWNENKFNKRMGGGD